MSIRRLKGSSIAEMIIVIAVISIISTIVLSFVVMSNETVRSSSSKVDALNDIAVVESIIGSWVEDKVNNNNKLTIVENNNNIINVEDQNIQLSFIDGELVEKNNNNEIINTLYKPSNVKSITFKLFGETTGNQLVICNITYEISTTNNNEKEYEYSFICYSYSYTQVDDNLLQGGNSNEENN